MHEDWATWFAKPSLGISRNYQGTNTEPELLERVYRTSPRRIRAYDVTVTGDLTHSRVLIHVRNGHGIAGLYPAKDPQIIAATDVRARS